MEPPSEPNDTEQVDEAAPTSGTVGDIVRLAIATDTARLIAHDPVARLGQDPEGVHQARVATRRLRSHLATFGPVLRGDRTKPVAKRLRDLGRALGMVRDLDVLRERFARTVDGFEPMVRGDGLALLAVMDAERSHASGTLLDVLSTKRYRTLLESLTAFAVRPPLRASADAPAEPFLLGAIKERVDALEVAIAALPPEPLDPQLHRVRITAKPARYAAELGGPVIDGPSSKLAKRLADLCDVLGLLNDGARANLWLDVAGEDPAMAFAVALIRAKEIERMAEARSEWPRRWDRVLTAAAELGSAPPPSP